MCHYYALYSTMQDEAMVKNVSLPRNARYLRRKVPRLARYGGQAACPRSPFSLLCEGIFVQHKEFLLICKNFLNSQSDQHQSSTTLLAVVAFFIKRIKQRTIIFLCNHYCYHYNNCTILY